MFLFAETAAPVAEKVAEKADTAASHVASTVESSREILVNSFTQAFNDIVAYTPRVVAMLVVLVVGYVIARILGRLVATVCEKIGLQQAAERSGLGESMKQVGISRTVPWILGSIVFWLLMFMFLTASFNILGMETVSAATREVVAYIPKLLVATVVVVVGLLIATLLRGIIATSADRVGLSYARHLANACYYLLAILVFIAAFDQLGIKFELINYAILIAFSAVALGFGLAFGLGGRDVMAGILAGYYTRQRLQPGDHVTVADLEGTVREVGPVATIVETHEGGLVSRHSIPNTKMLSEAVR